MVKPVYLYDIFRDDFLTIEPDQRPRIIGRAMDCDLVTAVGYGGIGRHHAQIQYFPNGDVKLKQNCPMSKTHWSPDGEDWEQLYTGNTELILPGYWIRFDERYDLRLFAHNSLEVQDRIAARDAEVERDGD